MLFDMDGTLVDSEVLTERAIAQLLPEWGIAPGDVDWVQFHGVTWERIAVRLVELFPTLRDRDLAAAIADRFQQLFENEPPALIPGAAAAFRAAAARFPSAVTIVTGSEARAVERLLDRTKLRPLCSGYTSCEMYPRSKPDPVCYRMAAERLGVAPANCLVFEDSLPGLEAAAAAGMWRIAITAGHALREAQAAAVTHGAIADFTGLPQGFFARL